MMTTPTTIEPFHESATILDALLEAAPVGIIISDAERRIVRWNPAAEQILGWTEDEVRGRPNPCIPDEHRAFYDEAMDRIMAGEALSGIEVERRHKDGSPVLLRVSTAPLRDASGAITGSMGILDDITERVALETQLRQSQKMEAIGQLAGGIAHDFNNHLTTILSLIDLVLQELPDDHSQRYDLKQVRQAARHSAKLTEQLLTFSRKQMVRPETVDVSAAVRDLGRMLERLMPETLTLELELGDACFVQIDPGQLQQILLNLAVNAQDAMPDGGTLTIRTRPEETEDGEALVRLDVIDTGVGMCADVRQRIFEPFFTTKTKAHGTGLGLATVYGIVEQAGGTISVESTEGVGTRFTLRLARVCCPQRRRQGTGADAPAPNGAPAPATAHVLVVEDDTAVRTLVKRILRREGFTVTVTTDGPEAMDRLSARDDDFDLVVCDVVMPTYGAFEVSKKLDDLRIDTPLLLMSGYANQLSGGDPLPDNVCGVLKKPFGPGQLRTAVLEALQTTSHQDA